MREGPLSAKRLLGMLRRAEETKDADRFIKALREYLEDEIEPKPSKEASEIAQTLRDRYGRFTEKHTFTPGQLVKWKQHLKNRRRPAYDEPVIVVEVLRESVLTEEKE